jgi:hypothetical protein
MLSPLARKKIGGGGVPDAKGLNPAPALCNHLPGLENRQEQLRQSGSCKAVGLSVSVKTSSRRKNGVS